MLHIRIRRDHLCCAAHDHLANAPYTTSETMQRTLTVACFAASTRGVPSKSAIRISGNSSAMSAGAASHASMSMRSEKAAG